MEVTQENYFSATQALYWFCVDYHGGISCPLYSIQCRLGYNPGCNEYGCDDDYEAQEFYDALENNEISPQTLFDEISDVVKSLDD